MAAYRAPFANAGEDRRLTLTWPRQIPIEGEPPEVVRVATDCGRWLAESRIPKLFINAEPGATGDTGGYTVEQLLEREHAVRALAHREDDRSKRLEKMGAEVVIGDLLKFNDVRAAMRGVRGAYFCYPIRPGILQATAYFAQAAKEAGLECVVNRSQKSAREEALSHAAEDHLPAEQVVVWSRTTAAQPASTYFAEW